MSRKYFERLMYIQYSVYRNIFNPYKGICWPDKAGLYMSVFSPYMDVYRSCETPYFHSLLAGMKNAVFSFATRFS